MGVRFSVNKTKNREVNILIFLLVILALYGFYTLLLSPKIEEARRLKEQAYTEDMIVRGMYTTIQKYEADVVALRDWQEQTKALTEHYYVMENQEQYLDDLGQMLEDCGVSYVKIESEYPAVPLLADEENYRYESPYLPYLEDQSILYNEDGTTNLSQISQKVEELSGEIPRINQMPITVEIEGTYSSVYKLIAQLDEAKKEVLRRVMELEVTSDSANARTSDPQVKVKMQLQFLRLVKLDCLHSEEFSELPTGFTMPLDFITGSYKKNIPLLGSIPYFG